MPKPLDCVARSGAHSDIAIYTQSDTSARGERYKREDLFLKRNETEPVVEGSTTGLPDNFVRFKFQNGDTFVIHNAAIHHRGVLWLFNGKRVRVGGTPMGANGKTASEIRRDADFAVAHPYCYERKGKYYQRTPGGGYVYRHDEDKHDFHDAVDIDFARVWMNAEALTALWKETQAAAEAFYKGRTVEVLSDWNGAAICSKAPSLRGKTFVVEWVIVDPHHTDHPIIVGNYKWRGGIPANEVRPLKKEDE